MGVFPGMQRLIQYSDINVIHHMNRLKNKIIMIISIHKCINGTYQRAQNRPTQLKSTDFWQKSKRQFNEERMVFLTIDVGITNWLFTCKNLYLYTELTSFTKLI